MTESAWQGDVQLHIFRAGFARPAHVDLFRKPTQPGKLPGWGGTFRTEPLLVPATGRGLFTFISGDEADVMVESFDAVTGQGTFFGLGAPPHVLH